MAEGILGRIEEKGMIISANSPWVHFLNFLLKPIRPTRPEPRSSMVEGSGTGEISFEVNLKSSKFPPVLPLFNPDRPVR
jgi:hypothetical protein